VILLDTTVLTYAVGDEHPLRDPCQRLLAAHSLGTVACATTIEVIQEFAYVRARRRPRAEAVARALDYMEAFSLLPTEYQDLRLGLELFEHHAALGAFDAVLAAVALNQRAEALISADRGFSGVPGLKWIDPATDALDRLLGA
jgi:predicted nucleic acid-binding protein